MKSEERHKLQQNELADYLARGVEKVKPYQNAILGGIILVLVIILISNWRSGSSAAVTKAANTKFSLAMDDALANGESSGLQEVAKDFPDSPVAALAALTAADSHLNNGANLLFRDKGKANMELGEASDLYQQWIPKLTNPLLMARARYGLARTKECQNLLSEAEKTYEEIVSKWPDGPYGVLAARRLEDIKRPATKAFYDNRFAKFTPSAFKDDSGLSDKTPLFDPNNLPKEPIYEPGSFGEKMGLKKEDLKTNELLKDKMPVGEEPVKDDKKADETKPAGGEQPGKPAEGEKPTTPLSNPPATTPPAAPTAPETPAPAQNPPSENKPEPTGEGK